jgi:hypothetical protein
VNTTLIRTNKESCRLITDRWGDTDSFQNSEKDLAAAKKLLPHMAGEESFIVEWGGVYGILIEIEFEHADSDDNVTITDEELFQIILKQSPALDKYSGVNFWCEVGPHIFNNRLSFRAFIPEGHELLDKSKEIYTKMAGF